MGIQGYPELLAQLVGVADVVDVVMRDRNADDLGPIAKALL